MPLNLAGWALDELNRAADTIEFYSRIAHSHANNAGREARELGFPTRGEARMREAAKRLRDAADWLDETADTVAAEQAGDTHKMEDAA